MKLTAPTTDETTTQSQPQPQETAGSSWDSLLGEEFLEDQLGAALKQGDTEDAAAEPTTTPDDGTTLDPADIDGAAEVLECLPNPWPSDPRIDNESGYYTSGWQEFQLPLRKRTKVKATVLVVETVDKTWQSGWYVEIDGKEGNENEMSHPLHSGGEQWATAVLAVADAVDLIDNYFALRVEDEKLVAVVREDLAKFADVLASGSWQLPEADVVGEAMAKPPEQPAETTPGAPPETPTSQPAGDSLPSINNPITPADDADAQKWYEARVRRQQALVADLCLEIARNKAAKKALDTAYKAAVQDLEETVENGPQAMPLFNQPKQTNGPQPGVEAETTEVSEQSAATALPDGAIGTKRVKLTVGLVAGVAEDKVIFGEMGDVATAFVSEIGGLYLVNGEHRWDLDPDEYEVINDGNESTDTPAAVDTEAQSATASSAQAVDQDFWRRTTIEQLNLPEGICKILHEDNNINTLGDITDWTTAHVNSPNPLLDLKKVGQAKADKIEQAIADYWKSVGSN